MANALNTSTDMVTTAIRQLEVRKRVAQRKLNKDRVLEFEKEFKGKIDEFSDIEKDILGLSAQRHQWFESLRNTESFVADLYFKKLDILKSHAELSALRMSEDALALEAHYEAQVLGYLVASTKPFDEGETEDERTRHLEHLARKDGHALQKILAAHIENRARLSSFNYELSADLKKMTEEIPVLQKHQADEMREKILGNISKMEESKIHFQNNHRRITSEYLVLRHNSKVAKEVLSRSKNDAALARVELQKCLDTIISDAKVHRSKMESLAEVELANTAESMRAEVVQKEGALEQITERVQKLKKERVGRLKSLKNDIRAYDKKYNDLQKKRKRDIKTISAELKRLRDMITGVESQLTAVTDAEAALYDEHYGLINSNRNHSAASAAQAEHVFLLNALSNKMKELQLVR